MPETDPRDLLPLTPATFHILLSVAAEPMHGYRIKRLVEDRTGGVVRLGAGTLYAGIRRMVRDALILETEPPSDTEDVEPGSRWRFYRITSFGSRVLELELERLEGDVVAARAVLPRPA